MGGWWVLQRFSIFDWRCMNFHLIVLVCSRLRCVYSSCQANSFWCRNLLVESWGRHKSQSCDSWWVQCRLIRWESSIGNWWVLPCAVRQDLDVDWLRRVLRCRWECVPALTLKLGGSFAEARVGRCHWLRCQDQFRLLNRRFRHLLQVLGWLL